MPKGTTTKSLAGCGRKALLPIPIRHRSTLLGPSGQDEYPWPLADRKEQFAVFQDMVTNAIPQRIFLIDGDSNTGKTVLLNELFKLAKALDLDSVLLDQKGCPTLAELFDTASA